MNKRRFLLAAAIALTSGLAHAQNSSWLAPPASGNWTDSTKWTGGIIADGSGNTADFSTGLDPTADITVTLNGNRTIGNLIFGDTDTSTAAGWIVTGNTLTLAGATPTITVNALGTNKVATISSIIDGTTGLTKSGTGTLVLTGVNIYTGGTTVSQGTLQLGDGSIQPTIGSGAYSVASGALLRFRYNTATGVTGSPTFSTVTGAGTLALATGKSSDTGWGSPSLAAGFTGTLQIEGGRVAPNTLASLGGSTAITILNGGHLGLYNLNNTTLTQNFTIAGTGYGETGYESAIRLANSGQSNTLSGTVALSASATIGASGTGTLSGVVSGAAGSALTFGTSAQAGTVILSGANTYSGNTNIVAGTLSVGTIADAGSSNLGITGAVAMNGGALRYTAVGASTTTNRTFSTNGAANSAIEITDAGTTLTIGSSFNSSSTSAAIAKRGSGTLSLTGAGDNSSLIINATAGTLLLGKASTATVHSVAGISDIATGATVKLTGTGGDQIYNSFSAGSGYGLVNMSGGTLDLNGSSEGWDRLTGTGTITSGAAGAVTLTLGTSNSSSSAGQVIQNGLGTVTLTKTGTGNLTLTGANTYTGGSNLNAGTLQFGKLVSTPATGTIAVGTGTTLAVNVGGTGEWTTGTSGVGTIGGLLAGLGGQGSSAVTYTGTVALGFDTTNATSTPTYSGNIANVGTTLGITKLGTGTFALAGANTFTGAINVNGGTLSIGGSGTLTSGTYAGNVTIASGATFDYASSANQTLSGTNSGAGALTVSGPGTLTIMNASTAGGAFLPMSYTGGTNITGGTLKVDMTARGNDTGFSMGNVNVAAGGTLELFTSKAVAFGTQDALISNGTVFTGTGTINKTGSGVADIWYSGSGATPSIKNFAGQINIQAGVLSNQTGADWSTSQGLMSVDISSGAFFDLRTDSAVINKLTGAGTVANSHSIALGLTVGGGNGNATFSGLIRNGGTFPGGSNTGSLFLTKIGSGTQTLNGSVSNTYTGATTVNGGTLKLDFANLATPTNLLAATTPLALGGGKLSLLGKSTGSTTQTMGSVTLAANTSSVIALDPNGGTSTNLTLGNSWTINTGASLFIDLTAAGTSTLTSNPPLTAGIINPNVVVSDAGGTGLATVVGGQVVRLTTGTVLTDINSDGTTGAVNFTTTPTDPAYVSGTLTLAAGTHTTNTLAISSGAGGTLDLNTTTLELTSNSLIMGGSGNYTIQNGTVGASGSALTVNQTGTGNLTISGTVTGGAGSLNKSGSGTLVLSGVNTYTGGTTISGGTLTIGGAGQLASGTYAGAILNNGTLQYSSSAAQTLSGVISGTGALLKDTNTSTLTLSGANTFTGNVDVNAGVVTSAALPAGATSFLGGPGTATSRRVVNIGTGTTVSYTNTTANSFLNLGGTVATGGYGSFYDFNISGTLAINDGVAVSQILQSTYNLNNGGIITNTGTANNGVYGLLFGWSGAGGGNINATGTGNQITADRIGFFNGATVTTNPGATLTISSIIGQTGGVSTLTKAGSGTLTLTNASTNYTGATTVNDGTLVLQDTLAFASAATVNSAGTLSLVRSVAGFANRKPLTNIISGSGVINVNNTGTGVAGGWVTFNGAAVGLSNFTGTINVNSGVLAMDNVAGLWSNSSTATVNVMSGGVFAIRAQDVPIGALNGNGDVANTNTTGGTAGKTLTIGGGNASGSFSGIIHGNIASGGTDGTIDQGVTNITKIGTGTQIFTGANTYSGPTTVSGGTLQLGNGTAALAGSAYTAGTYSIASGARLYLNQGTAPTSPTWANISGAGTLEVSDAATSGFINYAQLNLPAGFTGTLQVDNRGRVYGKPSNLGNATNVVVNNGAQFLAFDGTTSTYTFPQNFSINGMGSESGQNFGALRVSVMDATFSGNITLTGNAGFFSQVNAGSKFNVSGVISGGFDLTLNNFNTNPIVLSGANTYTGITRVNNGQTNVTGSLANNGPASVLMTAPDNTLTGNPILSRRVAAAASYTLGSSTGQGATAVSTDPITASALNTTAAILAGTASSQADVTMQWRTRTTAEAAGSNPNAVLSDVINLNGTGSDVFLFEMSYNDAALAALGLNEAAIAMSGELRLGWLDSGVWKTANIGNTGGTSTFEGTISSATFLTNLGANPLSSKLGSYGVDPSTNTVWAVLNHNSEFAVIPEPSTLVAGSVMTLGLALALRRRRLAGQ